MRTLMAVMIVFAVGCGDDDHDDHADAAPGQADAAPAPDAAPATVFSQQYSFARGRFEEPTLSLGADSWAAITVTSTGGDAYWNIHYHEGETITVYENDTSSEQYSFAPDTPRDYYFLVGNRDVEGTIDVDVRIAIFGTGSVN